MRWLLVDSVLAWLGISGEGLNFEKLRDEPVLAAYRAIVANHYRYYQYYSNSLIAIAGGFAAYVFERHGEKDPTIPWYVYLGFALFVIVLFLASYDTLKKMYEKMEPILK